MYFQNFAILLSLFAIGFSQDDNDLNEIESLHYSLLPFFVFLCFQYTPPIFLFSILHL